MQYMSPPQHLLAQLHQIRNAMFPIPDEFLKLESDQGDRLGSVELESSRQTFLGEETQVGEQELVLSMESEWISTTSVRPCPECRLACSRGSSRMLMSLCVY